MMRYFTHMDRSLTYIRPITSYGALEQPTYFIDLTPFVPILTDGNPHNISLDVVSAEDDHTINQNWFVSGNLQVVLDPSNKPTTGKITVLNAPPFAVTNTTGVVGGNDVNFTVSATRNIHIEADIVSGSGKKTHVVWSQSLKFSNTQDYINNSNVQVIAIPENVVDLLRELNFFFISASSTKCHWHLPLNS